MQLPVEFDCKTTFLRHRSLTRYGRRFDEPLDRRLSTHPHGILGPVDKGTGCRLRGGSSEEMGFFTQEGDPWEKNIRVGAQQSLNKTSSWE